MTHVCSSTLYFLHIEHDEATYFHRVAGGFRNWVDMSIDVSWASISIENKDDEFLLVLEFDNLEMKCIVVVVIFDEKLRRPT